MCVFAALLQKEKEEREKIEIQKVAEEIVSMTNPNEYRSQLESKCKTIDEIFQRHLKSGERRVESCNDMTKSSKAKESLFIKEFVGRHGGSVALVEDTIARLVEAIAAAATLLAPILQVRRCNFHSQPPFLSLSVREVRRPELCR